MDMSQLGLGDSSIRGIWCCAALLHVAKRDAPSVLAEFKRVLEPNGMLIVSVQQGTHDAPGWTVTSPDARGALSHPSSTNGSCICVEEALARQPFAKS
jgi:hypothetical protein